MSKKLLVTLKPIDKFFFGTDMTFAVPTDNKEKKCRAERFASYIIKSNRFPQQTSLLGMLRFLILSNSDCFEKGKIVDNDKKKDAVEKLIGPRSFTVASGGKVGAFGQIESLGACFLINNFDEKAPVFYSFAPFDSEFKSSDSSIKGFVNGKEISLPVLENYKAKDGYTERLKGSDGIFIPVSDVFVEDRRIGIARDVASGKTDSAGLFKQVGYRFKDYVQSKKVANWHFAFYVTVKDECKIEDYDGSIVSIGGDSSQFVFNVKAGVEDRRPELFDTSSKNQDVLKVVLQSPAYLKMEDFENVAFFFSNTIPFRFMVTSVKGTKDYTLRSGYQRSCRYELYAPGSVFYFSKKGDADSFKKALENHKSFCTIGYNEYK